ncbi:MAG: non-hydrolyzing UDP-N-acetylglucosamine 2-epimerase [Candidatus Methanofastidiosia archaeon]
MSIAIVLGTRPEIIKFSPIIRDLEKRRTDYFVIHTGQHYSFEMDKIFFEELELSEPKHHLNVGSGRHGEQTARMIDGIEKVFISEKPKIVLVEGDTNTVLAGSIVASKTDALLGHVEAGLRSYDRTMPEEINRVVSDHLSDLLFAPTQTSRGNLVKEGINEEKIFVTGNTVVDALFQNLKISQKRFSKESIIPNGEYILVTAHRQENVDNPARLKSILESLHALSESLNVGVLFPAHPRTVKMMKRFLLDKPPGVEIIKPVGYLEFLQLESKALLIVTDSGGVQEEACILNVPCVTIRENTERPETVDVGANILAGTEKEKIVEMASRMANFDRKWVNPYGDGKSGERIAGICLERG